jgi:hypothetical protein
VGCNCPRKIEPFKFALLEYSDGFITNNGPLAPFLVLIKQPSVDM